MERCQSKQQKKRHHKERNHQCALTAWLNNKCSRSEWRQSREGKRSFSGHSIPRSLFGCAIVWCAFCYCHLNVWWETQQKNRKEQQVPWVTSQKATGLCCQGNSVSLRHTLRLSLSEQSDICLRRTAAHRVRLGIHEYTPTITLNLL